MDMHVPKRGQKQLALRLVARQGRVQRRIRAVQRLDATILDFQRVDTGLRADHHITLTLEAFFEAYIGQIKMAVGEGGDLLLGPVDVSSRRDGLGLTGAQA